MNRRNSEMLWGKTHFLRRMQCRWCRRNSFSESLWTCKVKPNCDVDRLPKLSKVNCILEFPLHGRFNQFMVLVVVDQESQNNSSGKSIVWFLSWLCFWVAAKSDAWFNWPTVWCEAIEIVWIPTKIAKISIEWICCVDVCILTSDICSNRSDNFPRNHQGRYSSYWIFALNCWNIRRSIAQYIAKCSHSARHMSWEQSKCVPMRTFHRAQSSQLAPGDERLLRENVYRMPDRMWSFLLMFYEWTANEILCSLINKIDSRLMGNSLLSCDVRKCCLSVERISDSCDRTAQSCYRNTFSLVANDCLVPPIAPLDRLWFAEMRCQCWVPAPQCRKQSTLCSGKWCTLLWENEINCCYFDDKQSIFGCDLTSAPEFESRRQPFVHFLGSCQPFRHVKSCKLNWLCCTALPLNGEKRRFYLGIVYKSKRMPLPLAQWSHLHWIARLQAPWVRTIQWGLYPPR